MGGLGGDDLTIPVKRVLAASAVMAVATVLALNVSGAPSGFGLLARVVLAVVVGVVAYVATAAVLAERRPALGRSRPSGRPLRPGAGRRPTRHGPTSPTDGPKSRPGSRSMADSTTSPLTAPYGHLRPVSDQPEDEAAGGRGGVDGPDPGGNR